MPFVRGSEGPLIETLDSGHSASAKVLGSKRSAHVFVCKELDSSKNDHYNTF